ncbi:MAG: hypothetical protein V2J19_07745 [Wenzhouxiangella sp.]|jgi:hypothetical protein|nr:hypothetical protein [Wenzhouxiangella sp.]
MSNTLLLIIAVAVFSLLLIGLVLTALEFSRGEPARQEEEADDPTPDPDH